MVIYSAIFFLKLLENAFATLRLIVATNGKKILAAILQFVIGLVWVASASLAITNIKKDPLKIFAFAIGSAIGSYIGSIAEVKLALGKNVLFCITKEEKLFDTLDKLGYTYTTFNSNNNEIVILLVVERKVKEKLVNTMRSIDPKIMIISELSESTYGDSIPRYL